jgi:hypothetical protein
MTKDQMKVSIVVVILSVVIVVLNYTSQFAMLANTVAAKNESATERDALETKLAVEKTSRAATQEKVQSDKLYSEADMLRSVNADPTQKVTSIDLFPTMPEVTSRALTGNHSGNLSERFP